MCNNKNKHSGRVSCSACNAFMLLYGKTVRMSFIERNLQQMTRVTKGLCLYKNSDSKGLSAPAPGYIHV